MLEWERFEWLARATDPLKNGVIYRAFIGAQESVFRTVENFTECVADSVDLGHLRGLVCDVVGRSDHGRGKSWSGSCRVCVPLRSRAGCHLELFYLFVFLCL